MRAGRFLAVIAVTSGVVGPLARADEILWRTSFWDGDHDHIWSNLVVRHDDGTFQSRLVLGGSVDGVATREYVLQADGTEVVLDWVNTRNTDMIPLRWASSCVYITPDLAGTSHIAGDAEFDVIFAAYDAWTTQTTGCSYLSFVHNKPRPEETGYDGVNTVKFRDARWCIPAHGGMPESCHVPGATAITTVNYVDKPGRTDDGTILDADIEVNTSEFSMAICDDTGTSCPTLGNGSSGTIEDLQNTLTHEAGHVLGFDHNCFVFDPAHPSKPHPVDDMGQDIPDCFPTTSLPPAITQATMYFQEVPQETSKRSLSQDDIDAFCALYPAARDPRKCDPVDIAIDGGCGVAAAAARGADVMALLVGLALAGGLVRARRRRW